jgi:hypothetical protein
VVWGGKDTRSEKVRHYGGKFRLCMECAMRLKELCDTGMRSQRFLFFLGRIEIRWKVVLGEWNMFGAYTG